MQKYAFNTNHDGSTVDFVVGAFNMNDEVVVRMIRKPNRRNMTERNNNDAARAIKKAFKEAGVAPVRVCESLAEKEFFFTMTTLTNENKLRVADEIIRASSAHVTALADIFACLARTNIVPSGFVEPIK